MLRKVPLVVILGSTGTGKTKLSIELAQKFGGEIISADSMQVYKGLDIVTAKASAEEQAAAPHHLLDIVTPGQLFTVANFRDRAVSIVDDLLGRSKMPIVVGGTNYYIESLLWKVLVSSQTYESSHTFSDTDSDDDSTTKAAAGEPETDKISLDDLLKMTSIQMTAIKSTVLYEHLRKVDPTSANRLHPSNQRKIIRALEVFATTGKTITEVFEEQRAEEGGSNLGGPLRYPHIIMFWLQCDQDILNRRLDKRVDSMVEQGLVREIRAFHDVSGPLVVNQDYTKGVLQTIGFKEFLPYLEKFSEKDDESEEAQKALEACLEELKLVTRRYSKKQVKWVRNRLLAQRDRPVPPIYGLDTSDPSVWDETVRDRAFEVVEAYLEDREPRLRPLEKVTRAREGFREEGLNFCETCERSFVGEFEWQLHLKSNKHKRRLAGINKRKRRKLQESPE